MHNLMRTSGENQQNFIVKYDLKLAKKIHKISYEVNS